MKNSQSMVSTISSIIQAHTYTLYVYMYVLASFMCSTNLKIKGDSINRDDSFTSIILKGTIEKGLWKEKSTSHQFLKLKNLMCEPCTFSQIQLQI